MTLHVALTHRTTYRYDRPIGLGPQLIRLRPAPHCRTPILSYALAIEPEGHVIHWQQDPQGNFQARVVWPEKVTRFDVTVGLVADMAALNPFDFFLEPEAETWPFAYAPAPDEALEPFKRRERPGPLLDAFLSAVSPAAGGSTVGALVDLNRRVRERVRYAVRMEPGVWSPEETLRQGQGSCRDSGWLLVQVLRHLGVAARFVSGYLVQLAPDATPLEGPEGPAADLADLHAWAEAYLPGAGWVGLDPTSGLLAGEGHIPLAATPDPGSAAPVSGSVEACESEFAVHLAVTRIRESPRVTKPYAEPMWQDVLAAGDRVDAALTSGDLRLTMGSAPSFVAADDRDAPEWTAAVLGPTKRAYAGRLLRRLAERWSPGAVLQQVEERQAGERPARWALHAHGRADDEAVWRDPGLLAADGDGDTATPDDAARFAAALAERLHVDPDLVQPAYEDVPSHLWRERRLPPNVLAEDSKLQDPFERERLARVFGQGLGAPVGSVLPLRRAWLEGRRRWQSGRWLVRGGTLFLVPGDGAAGARLPVQSLPRADPELAESDADPDLVRTALAVEPRGGLLHVFLPPLCTAEDWLDLVAAVEATAAGAGRRVVLEGCLPPRDPGLLSFSITPGAGVIRVTVPAATTWAEIVSRTAALGEDARAVGLAAQRFLLDGRPAGTGGGSPVTMGAARAEDSPFLRRPDLLRSLIGFWHNHPSLSYLFSGRHIGPAGRHPRVDEARHDGLTELEAAFSAVGPGREMAPDLVDRVFRDLLADGSGGTRRAEFGVDQLYPPGHSSDRLGVVALRALEMPPHARMAAAQMLLMRSALAAFWQRPYERRLVRWGTRLHDEFMLPHYVEQDFHDALEDLAGLGFPLDRAWFAPHLAFRFPVIGETTLRGSALELRQALEPWPALGVERSAERIQVTMSGWVDERFVLACNGRAVPLARTEREGEHVGGVRFRAWVPPSGSHPAPGAPPPLVFDLYDRWSGHSLGGATYHVAPPGGVRYEALPVNAGEAEARRRARFQPFGHPPGPMAEPTLAPSREQPRTLDLRWVPAGP